MIFEEVTNLKTLAEKNFFKEKIKIYIMLVSTFCEQNNIKMKEISNEWKLESINIGVISKEEDLLELEKVLGKTLFKQFAQAVTVYLKFREEMGDLLFKLSNSERTKIQKEEKKQEKISMVDLFCGAGGMSLGFIQSGYSVKFANDFEPMCIETYKYNHPEIPTENIYCGDIRKIAAHIDKYVKEDIDIVIGGPPCQGFSSANKRFRVIDDPRNELYKYYIKAVEKLLPKFVVMENVKGMLKVADEVIEDYTSLKVSKDGKTFSYQASYRLLNSADFSVAQNRERLIYIAIRNDICEKHEINPETIFTQIDEMNKTNSKYNLADALEYIRPLVAPNEKNVGERDTEENGRKIDVNSFTGYDNDYLKLINQGRKIPLVYNHKARYISELNYQIYSRMNQGDDATDSKIADIMPYSHRNDKFKDKYYRLYGDRPCRTITAHLRSDCHSHIHPFQDRALTPREAARVQSFPDDYMFLGPYLKTYIQIGNAVPVVMARGIAEVIKKFMG